MMYDITMPTKSSTKTTHNKDGSTSESLVIEFSNGSLEQLKELATFFEARNGDPAEVLELGIGILQRVREQGKTKEDRANAKSKFQKD